MNPDHPHHYTSELPASLYTAEQTRELDSTAVVEGIAGFDLMSRAGRVAFDVMKEKWPGAKRVTIFCGGGNNGGDGYIIASLARQSGMSVTLIQMSDPSRLKGDALLAFGQARADQVDMKPFDRNMGIDADVVVDAMLGTGLSGEVRDPYASAIQLINHAGLPALAVDIPSGLCSDTGVSLGVTLQASVTVTFIGMKQGLLTGQAPRFCGELIFGGLAVPWSVYEQVPVSAELIQPSWVRQQLPARPRDAHKGLFGHLLVIGGDLGMGGAVAMAAEAAGRCGAGLVSVITRSEHVPAILSRRPECMVLGCDEGSNIEQAIEKATAIVAGPGIGRGRWAAFLLEQALASEVSVVLDADGLNYLAALAEQSPDAARRGNWILTPHPGEAARLLQSDSRSVQQDRFRAVTRLCERFDGTVLLKGAGTLIKSPECLTRISDTGNPGMASGGMGDVLSGVIGALVAQGMSLHDAASAGAWIHGAAADRNAALTGERGMLATDLMPHLQALVNNQ
ncbi:MAG: NAD(P)H-hydrate dehydratase [Ketobacteraceae bacterium]|nr:NAD(P)H-hydrate dehydratase [Ketobacteraceae bacterium]